MKDSKSRKMKQKEARPAHTRNEVMKMIQYHYGLGNSAAETEIDTHQKRSIKSKGKIKDQYGIMMKLDGVDNYSYYANTILQMIEEQARIMFSSNK